MNGLLISALLHLADVATRECDAVQTGALAPSPKLAAAYAQVTALVPNRKDLHEATAPSDDADAARPVPDLPGTGDGVRCVAPSAFDNRCFVSSQKQFCHNYGCIYSSTWHAAIRDGSRVGTGQID